MNNKLIMSLIIILSIIHQIECYVGLVRFAGPILNIMGSAITNQQLQEHMKNMDRIQNNIKDQHFYQQYPFLRHNEPVIQFGGNNMGGLPFRF